MNGVGGYAQLRVGYHVAAELGGWHLNSEPVALNTIQSTLTANVVKVDEFWSTQGPITLAVDMGLAWWLWTNAVVIGSIVAGKSVTVVVVGNPTPVSKH